MFCTLELSTLFGAGNKVTVEVRNLAKKRESYEFRVQFLNILSARLDNLTFCLI